MAEDRPDGLLVPFYRYKFSIQFLDSEGNDLFCDRLVESFQPKMTSYHSSEFQVVYRDDVRGGIYGEIIKLMKGELSLGKAILTGISPNDNAVFAFTIKFDGSETVAHEVCFDYNSADVLRHKISITFNEFSFNRLDA